MGKKQRNPAQAAKQIQKLRWYQFSLRSLLIFVMLFAFICSWLGVKMQQARKQKETIEAIHKVGGVILYEYEVEEEEHFLAHSEPYGPIWLRRMLGDDFFNGVSKVFLYPNVVDSDLASLEGLKELKKLKQLNLNRTQITDAGLEHLEGLKQLEYLVLSDTKVTDAGIKKLHKILPKVKIFKEDKR